MCKQLGFALTVILVLAASSWAEPEKLDEVMRFLKEYHRAPAPERVPKMLDALLDEKLIELPIFSLDRPEQTLKLTGHAFGLIARNKPKLIRLYEARFPKASKAGRRLLVEAFWVCGDQQTLKLAVDWEKDPAQAELKDAIQALREFLSHLVRPLPRDLPARNPTDLDLLWTDFLITGEYAPVSRILDVLDRPDHLRARIDTFLAKHPEKREELFKTLDGLGFVQPGAPPKLVEGDLDLRLVELLQDGSKRPPRSAMQKFNQTLGFKAEEYVTVFALKGAASWAAQSNLQQHPRLREVMKAHEAERPAKSRALVKQWLGQ
jgi:hypothetical protein